MTKSEIGIGNGDQTENGGPTESGGEAVAEKDMASQIGMGSNLERLINLILRSLKRIKDELLWA